MHTGARQVPLGERPDSTRVSGAKLPNAQTKKQTGYLL